MLFSAVTCENLKKIFIIKCDFDSIKVLIGCIKYGQCCLKCVCYIQRSGICSILCRDKVGRAVFSFLFFSSAVL